jgi:predicted dehydrogenase
MNVGIVGCGLMGRQRAVSLAQLAGHRLVSVYDPDGERARKIASEFACRAAGSWQALLRNRAVECVIVAVPHHLAAEIAVAALRAGKYVFCEKPLGRNMPEGERVLKANGGRKRLGVGFNYRFYPAIREAHRLIAAGAIGEVTHMRCVMGHGARPGYENEWKTSKTLCGGGALLDPGIHLIDLARFFLGEITSASASLFSSYWAIDVEDNAFLTIETENRRHAQVHVSITEWKSRFALDLFGTDGEISITGRSGFYGAQTLRHTRRWGWLRDEREAVTEYPAEDISFRDELAEYLSALEGAAPQILAGETDAIRALAVVDRIYRAEIKPIAVAAGSGPLQAAI